MALIYHSFKILTHWYWNDDCTT